MSEEIINPPDFIRCRGVKTHNLQNISMDIPLKKWTAVTGVSGSGKSSLVFDTIYAESQRRFLETLGTYERQFLQGLPQGEFESIEPIPAAIALKQNNKTGDPRSVIASAADVSDVMRTLFTSLMDDACIFCGHTVQIHRSSDALDILLQAQSKKGGGDEYLLTVPYTLPQKKQEKRKLCTDLLAQGYTRFLADGEILPVEDADGKIKNEDVEIILDRISSKLSKDEITNRVETAWSQIKFSPRFSGFNLKNMSNLKAKENSHHFYVQPFCIHCQKSTSIIQSSDLDWQSALGYCKRCEGLGNIPVIDEEKVIPNPKLSLKEGAIKPWSSETFSWINDELLRECKKNQIDTEQAYEKLPKKDKDFIWYGDKNSKKKSDQQACIQGFFDVLNAERYKSSSRILLAKYRKYVICPDCDGKRVGKVGQNATCLGKTFPDLFLCEIRETLAWTVAIRETPAFKKKIQVLSEIYKEVEGKISLLCKLGLGSAQLFRRCKTLSGGEYQRVLLARVIGNGLTDALYVLDEPSVGLGKNELPALIHAVEQLRDLGNTVLMVEHDKTLIAASDYVVELGPGGGKDGGKILPIENGQPKSAQILVNLPKNKRKFIDLDKPFLKKENSIFLSGFSANNCKQLNLEVALGKLNVICGPSGAGKSTLVHKGLGAALEKLEENHTDFQQNSAQKDVDEGSWDSISVPKNFFKHNEVIYLQQKALHRTITSVPGTLLGLMDFFRKKFSQLPDAKKDGFGPSDFSFNGAGGCEVCGGKGIVEEDLFFLGDVEKVCPECNGQRYRQDVLNFKWEGRNIFEWLNTTMEECRALLYREPEFIKPIITACELGLGHIQLGLPTSSMSGGEAQRLRICAALSKSSQKIFCILDEPTRGLSEKDVGQLASCLLRLTQEHHTFVVVEHHEYFQSIAHHLIQMGPGGGHEGGKIIERSIMVD